MIDGVHPMAHLAAAVAAAAAAVFNVSIDAVALVHISRSISMIFFNNVNVVIAVRPLNRERLT